MVKRCAKAFNNDNPRKMMQGSIMLSQSDFLWENVAKS